MRVVESLLANALLSVGRATLQMVLPSWCVACGGELPLRGRTASCCPACWASLPKIDGAKCRSCAVPIPGGTVCLPCMLHPLPLDWCDAWGSYRDALQQILHAFKFDLHDFYDTPLAGLLHETLRERGDFAFDAIVPIPMTSAKERRRGYNQAELLARALAERTGIPSERLLTKTRDGASQSTLAKEERAANVHKAFAASPETRKKSILLVDDICTTGETLRACARELQKRGATRVCAISVAKAT